MFITNDSINVKGKELIQPFPLFISHNGVILFCGPNGCGKTLYLKNIFTKLLEQKVNVKFVDQGESQIIKTLNIDQNIYMDLESHLEQECSHLKAGKLSGGEKRYISILRAFNSDANIIILDEPTNDLDYQHVEKLKELIESKKKEKLFIIVSHDDRLEEITDCKYEYNNHTFHLTYNHIIKDNKSENSRNSLETNVSYRFILKSMKYNYLLLITLIATIYIIFNNYKDFSNEQITIYPKIEERRIDLFLSQFADYKPSQNCILPLKEITRFIQNDISISDISKQTDNDSTIIFNLNNLHSTELYDLYKLEYFNPKEISTPLVLSEYKKLSSIDDSEYYITLEGDSDFDYWNVESSKTGIPLDYNQYQKAVETIESDSNNKLTHAVIILKENVSFEDFLEDEQIQSIDNENVYIYCNRSIDIANEISAYNKVKSYIKSTSISLLFVHIVECFFILLYLRLNESNIAIFKNYGVSNQVIKRSLNLLNNNTYLKELVIFSFITNVIVHQGISNILINLSTILVLEIMLIFITIFKRLVIKYYIKYVYNWRFRR